MSIVTLLFFWEGAYLLNYGFFRFFIKTEKRIDQDKAVLLNFIAAAFIFGACVLPSGNIIVFLFVTGMILKAFQFALMSKEAPASSLLNLAILFNILEYIFIRSLNVPPDLNQALAITGILLVILASGAAFLEKNIKRIIGLSVIAQFGFILLSFGSNTAFSLRSSLTYILAFSLADIGLFLCAGIIESRAGTSNIEELGGLKASLPRIALAYLLCAFSLIGIPPFLGFWPKVSLELAELKKGDILMPSLAALGALLTLFYLMRLFNKVFLGEEKIKIGPDKNVFAEAAALACGFLLLILGLLKI